jgi:hypothetical protein
MSTNPNNAVGTNGAFGGRTSVNALNDVLAAFSGSGILSGWKCVPSSGMTVAIGGQDNTIRDVAIAEDPYGNRTTINNISQAPISVTISPSSTSSHRYTSIVAYVNSPTDASDTSLDNPTVAGIIAVDGTPTGIASPLFHPTDAQIRTAITADGGTGSAAYYVKLADILVEWNLTVITSTYILQEYLGTGLSPLMQERPYRTGNRYSYTSTATTSGVTLQTISADEDGTYFVFCDGWINENGKSHSSNIYPAINIYSGTNKIAGSQLQLIADSDTTEQHDLDVMAMVSLSRGNQIKIEFQQNNSSVAGLIYEYNFGMFKISS